MAHPQYAHDIEYSPADIRRRRRLLHGASSYTLKVLVEALRHKGLPLRGSRIALLGFSFDATHPHAGEIRALLIRSGAHVAVVAAPLTRHKLDDDTVADLAGASAVLIATEHPVFRAIRPKELREAGIDIVIPATTRA